jgi:hypothetical protein
VALSGTSTFLRFKSEKTPPASLLDFYTMEVSDLTATLDSSGVPVVTVSAEASPYLFDATLTNASTGESIKINAAIPLNDTLEINTEEHTISHVEWGAVDSAVVVESSVRWDVLRLRSSSSLLQYDESNVQAVTLALEWRDRNS